MHDAEVDRHLTRPNGKRRRRGTGDMAVDQIGKWQRRQKVTVHHEYSIRVELHRGKRSGRSEWFVLAPVDELDSKTAPVTEVRLDQLGEVSDGEIRALESGSGNATEQNLENRHVSDGHERLRQDGRVRAQPRAGTAR